MLLTLVEFANAVVKGPSGCGCAMGANVGDNEGRGSINGGIVGAWVRSAEQIAAELGEALLVEALLVEGCWQALCLHLNRMDKGTERVTASDA